MPRERTAARLEEAAFNQLVTVGADSLTMEGIAQRAGVSIGAAYRWQSHLEEVVWESIRLRLPTMAERMAASASIERWLQPQAFSDRLLTESLLAVRRFPKVAPVVAQAVDVISAGLLPLGTAVVVGSQALMVAGCSMSAHARQVLASLNHRAQQSAADGPLPWSLATPVDFVAAVADTATVQPDPIGQSLIDATARVLASPAEATARTIAESAGVTTGAIYRRYPSKDQLVADTMRNALTADRTAWAVPFVARLIGTQFGDPAQILADQLAVAGDQDYEQTRLSVEFIVASRVSPEARQVLVARLHQAQQSRQALFDAMYQAGIFTWDAAPLALSWALQVTPSGVRLLSLVGPQPGASGWQPMMASLIRAL